MSEIKRRVLVTAIGTAASTAIISALAKDTFHIIGTDIYPQNQVATSKDVDEFYVFPSAVADRDFYLDYALKFCVEHSVNYYFATIDEEIAGLSAHRSQFESAGVKLCIPNAFLVETCHFKDRFNRFVADEIPEIAIKTYDSRIEAESASYPLFAKPIEGRASIGCKRIDDASQLADFLGTCSLDDYILQEYVSGEVITVDMVRNAETGEFVQSQRIELLRNSSGCGIAVETIYDETLASICEKLAIKLALNGVVNAEFFRNNGKYWIIEVNPRFSAGTSFSVMAGCSLPEYAVSIAAGENLVFYKPAVGKYFAKRYEVYEL